MTLSALGIFSAAGAGPLGRIGVAGYATAGNVSGGAQNGTVDKILFSNDTVSSLGTGLSLARYYASGFANSGVAGYINGGSNSAVDRTTVDKFAFPADTRTTLGTGLSIATSGGSGFANSGVAGYAALGGFRTTIDKFAFPADTRTTLATGLTSNRAYGATAENTLVAGYYAGGDTGSAPTSAVDKFSYPSDTRSSLGSGLVAGAWYSSVGLSNNAVAIYFQDNASTTMTKYAMPSDTRSSFASGTNIKTGSSCQSNSGVAAYISGGQIGPTLNNVIEKVLFSNDSRSTVAATLSFTSTGQVGMANQGVF